MKNYLSVGEICKLFDINVQTLYYYDAIGLFRPSERNSGGQRKYSFDKIYGLATIRYMRKLGYSLDDIKDYKQNLNVETALESLKLRSVKLRQEWEELLNVDEAINRKIKFIEEQMQDLKVTEASIKNFPERKYIDIGKEEILYHDDSFYFYPTIAFYEGDNKSFGSYIYMDDHQQSAKINEKHLRIIEEGAYLCFYHKGPYETVMSTIEKVRIEWNHLNLSALSINFNVVDQFVESDPANYITNIQIRVENDLIFDT